MFTQMSPTFFSVHGAANLASFVIFRMPVYEPANALYDQPNFAVFNSPAVHLFSKSDFMHLTMTMICLGLY